MHAATPYISQILGWADAYHKRTGQWPNLYSGRIWGKKDDTWRRVDSALRLRDGRLKNASRSDEKSFDVEYFYESAGH